ncbi:MAG: chemotaxis-specific protein-glutamate methyltransferase CheB [Sphingomonadaceae bacterium]
MLHGAIKQRKSLSGARPLRVLIIDDSAVARAALSRMLSGEADFEVVAALDGARRAIDWLATHRTDIILLDIQMPGLDGLAALPELIAAGHGAHILIVSTLAETGARATIEALALGATDTLAKPAVGELGGRFAALLVDRLRRLGEAAPREAGDPGSEPFILRPVSQAPLACLAIGASTGGLHALAAFFATLPCDFDPPILVTQHLPTAFMPFFAEQLARMSGRHCTVAADGAPLVRGAILVAPGDAHLGCVLRRGAVRAELLTHAVASRCRPSVDPMFETMAVVFGSAAMGVVLTGMGRDGASGAAAIVEAGGSVIAQDAASSAVWGMPGAVSRAGLASVIAPPAKLARHVAQCGVRS